MGGQGRLARGAVWVVLMAAAIGVMLLNDPAAGAKKKGEIVVLGHDRWLDTLRGTVKNFSSAPARDVTIVVQFVDGKRKALGTQQVSVGELGPGEQASFEVAIEQGNRAARSYAFKVHAIWP
jgi:hypothetical protein